MTQNQTLISASWMDEWSMNRVRQTGVCVFHQGEAATEDRAPRPSGFSLSCSRACRDGRTDPGADGRRERFRRRRRRRRHRVATSGKRLQTPGSGQSGRSALFLQKGCCERSRGQSGSGCWCCLRDRTQLAAETVSLGGVGGY